MSPAIVTLRRYVVVAVAGHLLASGRTLSAQTAADAVAAPRVVVTAYLRADSLSRVAADSVGRVLAAVAGRRLAVMPRATVAAYVAGYVYGPPDGPFELADLRALATMFRAEVLYDVVAERDADGVRAAAVAVTARHGSDSATVAWAQGPDAGAAARALAARLAAAVNTRRSSGP